MREVWVLFHSSTINRVLGLSKVDNNEYRELFRSPYYDKILKMVAGANASWKIKKHRGLYEIVRGSLIVEAKAWFYS